MAADRDDPWRVDVDRQIEVWDGSFRFRQAPRDGQPQPGAAVDRVGAALVAHLLERLEHAAAVRLGDAGAGVFHAHGQLPVRRARPHPHVAARGELDGVGHQRVQDLPEALRYARERVEDAIKVVVKTHGYAALAKDAAE